MNPFYATSFPATKHNSLPRLAPSEQRTITLGFVLPTGDVEQLGLVTNWQHPVTGGTPIWFYLEDDPAGPFVDAISPPPPTALFLDTAAALGGAADSSSSQWGRGRWPTTGTVTRGFGCEPFFTGVHGAGFGCPADRPWFHNGIDIANTAGTAIWSPMDGTVVYAGPHPTGPDCSHIAGSVAPHSGLGNYQTIAGS